MRGISYQGTVQYFGKEPKTFVRFFTNPRVRAESPKTETECNDWISSVLREHGTNNCRATLAKVTWTITG